MTDDRAGSARRFVLEVCPETEGSRWRATVRTPDSLHVVRFEHPLELLRWLAGLTLADRGGGLR